MAYREIFSKLKALLGAAGAQQPGDAPRGKITAADRQLAEKLLDGLVSQVLHEREMVEARGKEPLLVRLVPQVPVRDRDQAVAWIGGGARLPDGLEWPTVGDSAFQLLVQVDCSRLPAGLWDGLGPRHGWLAIFLDPQNVKARVLHFSDAGEFRSSPPILKDCSITGYDGYKRAEASDYTWGFPRWPIDIVPVEHGRDDPYREGRGRSQIESQRYDTRHDIVTEQRWPFDWPTAQMMIDGALSAYDGRISSSGLPDFLKPEVLAKAKQAIIDAEQAGAAAEAVADMRINYDERCAMVAVQEFNSSNCAAIVDRLRALKARIDAMAASETFSSGAIGTVLAEMKAMVWMHKSVPPQYRDGQKLSGIQRAAEGVQTFALPLTTHDPAAAPSWVYHFETRLLEAAKSAYLRDPTALPAALVADCEEVWRDQAACEMVSMGHVPQGYVHQYDQAEDVTLVEIPSSRLIGWQFGDVYNLVITVKKAALSRGDFSEPLVQVSN
ncbi:DUF1963 domain-containing protein [Bradyrhizobium sp. USDA 4454]